MFSWTRPPFPLYLRVAVQNVIRNKCAGQDISKITKSPQIPVPQSTPSVQTITEAHFRHHVGYGYITLNMVSHNQQNSTNPPWIGWAFSQSMGWGGSFQCDSPYSGFGWWSSVG